MILELISSFALAADLYDHVVQQKKERWNLPPPIEWKSKER